ncbi:glycoside hydrolase family 43 protein [Oryzihumus sp.]|jgi:beta-xylosidase|uniref:glycoside hydrolase family 43 protein n=1 Tax=Oryzihumus sp. TaxID=1968903 RepID=UPI002EDB6A8F
MGQRRRRVWVLVALVLTVASAVLAGPAATAQAQIDVPWFKAGAVYRGNFPDPDVVRFGHTWYAYATNTGGAYVPVMTSTDLRTWVARPAYNPGASISTDPWFNDALPRVAPWAARSGPGKWDTNAWAPTVRWTGGHYVMAYVAPRSLSPYKQCISVATSASPLGPFTDTTRAPLVCSSDPRGSIDPALYLDARGTPFLVWKNEGVPGCCPTRLWSRQLAPGGTAFAPGSLPHNLLTTAQKWEGNLIEGPSLVGYAGRLYLFYSANNWSSPAYATGYAICASALGPCTRPTTSPLLASGSGINGPGGPTGFVDLAGHLRLGYAAWNAPWSSYQSYPACTTTRTCGQAQRFFHVATLTADSRGLLHVASRG